MLHAPASKTGLEEAIADADRKRPLLLSIVLNRQLTFDTR